MVFGSGWRFRLLKEISRIAQRIQASLPPSSLGNSLYCLETPSTGKSSSSDSRNYHHIMCKEVNNVNALNEALWETNWQKFVRMTLIRHAWGQMEMICYWSSILCKSTINQNRRNLRFSKEKSSTFLLYFHGTMHNFTIFLYFYIIT